MITQQRLKDLFNYDLETGVFTRKIKTTNSAKLGETAGSIHPTKKYRYMRIDNAKYMAHRLAWLYVFGQMPLQQIDHINGVRDDNRINNLRDVTNSINAQNKKLATSKSKSGILGVSWMKNAKKWRAQIQTNKKITYLGIYENKQDAQNVYLNAKLKFHSGYVI